MLGHEITQSIKDIVIDHSEDEIFSTLNESNMNPNETIVKLLSRGEFSFYYFIIF